MKFIEKLKIIQKKEIQLLHIYEVGSKYGESVIEKYSEKLIDEVGKKYNYRTLYRMRKLYIVFSNEKLTPLVSKLTWSHYIQLLSIKIYNEITYYINQCIKYNLSKRQLQEKTYYMYDYKILTY